ncbi:phage capsid scaffolding protein [Halomonas cupida]|uniref:Phage capsid scaffolding protein n=1 Tax=Halomonas cupida TaxID=44933 RepID=A0A1M7KHN1_9GAMM|nr:GPO family capsid scaffolding protein [Halomonas cupida]GEN25384.1 phage capsid scaffolding protein [Halomonas cupida]SHM64838.1 Phage capsid scaffolding protein (GPO) serine peptidase [Halomonas cupida]
MPWFRVATEGATTDGREISRDQIEQMAANYNPKKYGARVWMEHMRGLFADGPFPALGDVKAVKAEEVEDGKLGLFADIDPTDQLKEINGKRQKVYTSIEINPSFADTGEAYLEGLAVTDSPASLGTEMLKFSRQAGKDSPLAAKKQHPENVFSEAIEIEFDFSQVEQEDTGPTLAERVKTMFKRHDAKTGKGFEAFRKELEETLELFVQRHQDMADELERRPSAEAFTELKEAHEATQAKLDELYTKLDNTPDTPNRGAATGGGDAVLTDC